MDMYMEETTTRLRGSTMSKQQSKRGRRKGGVSRSEDQAQAMLKWAVDEMKLSTDTLPNMEDLNT